MAMEIHRGIDEQQVFASRSIATLRSRTGRAMAVAGVRRRLRRARSGFAAELANKVSGRRATGHLMPKLLEAAPRFVLALVH